MTSFVDVNFLAGRTPLDKYCSYKHAILLHKIYNNQTPELDFIALSLNQNFNLRNANFMSCSTRNYKIGKNKLSEGMTILNDKIKLNDLNLEPNPL